MAKKGLKSLVKAKKLKKKKKGKKSAENLTGAIGEAVTPPTLAGAKKKKKKGKKKGKGKGKSIKKKIKKEATQDVKVGEELIERFLPDLDAIGGVVDADRSDEITKLLAQLEEVAAQAPKRTDETADIITRLQAGLGGLSAAENTALIEQSTRGVDQQFANALRQASIVGNRRGVRGAAGGAAALDLGQQRALEQRKFEQDRLLANVDIQDRRRNSLANFLGLTEQAEFNRGFAARQQFAGQLTGARADELGRQQFNIGQKAKLTSGQASLFLGGQAVNQARRNSLRNFRLGKEGVDVARLAALSAADPFAGLSDLFAGLFPSPAASPPGIPPTGIQDPNQGFPGVDIEGGTPRSFQPPPINFNLATNFGQPQQIATQGQQQGTRQPPRANVNLPF